MSNPARTPHECAAHALQLEGDGRDAFIAELGHTSPALRDEVLELLDRSAQIDRWLGGRDTDELVPWHRPGADVDGYTVVRHIARGGMGDVLQVKRNGQDWALKVLRTDADGLDLQRRFRAERNVLASLRHDNIVAHHDSGVTAWGAPYLVMEYIRGEPIDCYCRGKRLPLEQRVALMAQVCRAVAQAHAKMIVHRDIKPSNILVDEHGTPKLLDFGIAKCLDAANDSTTWARTGTSMQLMTPAYASPEQLRGEALGASSDIYSLGVVLYELLTGRHPYPQLRGEQLRRAICHDPVHPPSRSTSGHELPAPARNLRGDLDHIVLKALRKEPSERYASADGVATDLQRFVDGVPIGVRRDALSYRVRRTLRRHGRSATATALILGTLLGTAALAWARQRELDAERVRIVALREDQDLQRKLANHTALFVEQMLRELPIDAAETRRSLIDKSMALARSHDDNVIIQAHLMHALSTAAASQGDLEGAVRISKETMDRLQQAGRRDILVRQVSRYVSHLVQDGRYSEALVVARAHIEEATVRLGPHHVGTVNLRLHLAGALRHAGEFSKAWEVLRQVQAGIQPSDTQPARWAHSVEALLLRDEGRYDEAHRVLDEAEAKERTARGEAALLALRGNLWFRQGHFAAAEHAYRRSIGGLGHTRARFDPRKLHIYTGLAAALESQGRSAEVCALFSPELRGAAALLRPGHPERLSFESLASDCGPSFSLSFASSG